MAVVISDQKVFIFNQNALFEPKRMLFTTYGKPLLKHGIMPMKWAKMFFSRRCFCIPWQDKNISPRYVQIL